MQISVRIEPALLQHIDQYADDAEISRTFVIEDALMEYFRAAQDDR